MPGKAVSGAGRVHQPRVDLVELVLDCCLPFEVLTVQALDELMGRLCAPIIWMVPIAERELAPRRRMNSYSPAARFVTIILPEQLVEAGTDRADNAEFGQIRTEARPEAIIRTGLIYRARVHLKPVPDRAGVESPGRCERR